MCLYLDYPLQYTVTHTLYCKGCGKVNTYTARQIAEQLQQDAPDMNLRTVRYYTQIGLIPSLEVIGNRRVYTDVHLSFLRAIVTLSKTGDTLAAIREKISSLTLEEVEKIGDKLSLYRSGNVMDHDTVHVSEDVILTVGPRISSELKEQMMITLSRMLKGEQ